MGAAGAAAVAGNTVAGGQQRQFGRRIRGDPLGGPVTAAVIQIVIQLQIPVIIPVRVVRLDVGEVEQHPAVILAVLADVLVVEMDVAVARLRILVGVFPFAFRVAGHEDEGDVRILADQFFHVGDVTGRVVPVDAAPGPDHHVDVAVGRIVQQVAGSDDPGGVAVSVHPVPLAEIGATRDAVIVQVQRVGSGPRIIPVIPGPEWRVGAQAVHPGDQLAAVRGVLVSDVEIRFGQIEPCFRNLRQVRVPVADHHALSQARGYQTSAQQAVPKKSCQHQHPLLGVNWVKTNYSKVDAKISRYCCGFSWGLPSL